MISPIPEGNISFILQLFINNPLSLGAALGKAAKVYSLLLFYSVERQSVYSKTDKQNLETTKHYYAG